MHFTEKLHFRTSGVKDLTRYNSEKIALQLKAALENVTELTPAGDDFRWYIKLKCNSCGDETQSFVYLDLLESQPLKGGRGSASLVIKCGLCSRENSIDIVKDSIRSYNAEDTPNFKTIVAFDCRGVEPTEFSPKVGWTAKGEESGTMFDEVDLSEGDWVDYDEKAKGPVGVSEIESQFVRV